MNNINAVTKCYYSVSNQVHLEAHKKEFDLTSDFWAGFNQWKQVGRKVKKGAKGCKIFMVWEKQEKPAKPQNDENKKTKTLLKALYVFNIEHTEEL